MLYELDVRSITQYHDAVLRLSAGDQAVPITGRGPWPAIAANHEFNLLLWREEDKARRRDVTASEIAANKRHIDAYNQQRNDAVEAIDEAILAALAQAPVAPAANAWLSSETAGAMIDRLSKRVIGLPRSLTSTATFRPCADGWGRFQPTGRVRAGARRPSAGRPGPRCSGGCRGRAAPGGRCPPC